MLCALSAALPSVLRLFLPEFRTLSTVPFPMFHNPDTVSLPDSTWAGKMSLMISACFFVVAGMSTHFQPELVPIMTKGSRSVVVQSRNVACVISWNTNAGLAFACHANHLTYYICYLECRTEIMPFLLFVIAKLNRGWLSRRHVGNKVQVNLEDKTSSWTDWQTVTLFLQML